MAVWTVMALPMMTVVTAGAQDNSGMRSGEQSQAQSASTVDQKLQEIARQLRTPESRTRLSAIRIQLLGLRQTIARETQDPQTSDRQLLEVRKLEMITARSLLELGLEDKYSAQWQLQAIGDVEVYAQGLSGPEVDETLARVAQIKARAQATVNANRDAVLDLARSGWTLRNFIQPRKSQREELKARQLPESYRELPDIAKQALKAYYEPLAAEREVVPYEKAIKAYIENPQDQAAITQVLQGMRDQMDGLFLDDAPVTSHALVPDRIWTQALPAGRSFDLAPDIEKKRALVHFMSQDIPAKAMMANANWPALIKEYTRCINVYPHWHVLRERALVHIHAGQWSSAWDDLTLAMAVFAWERANALPRPDENILDWSSTGYRICTDLEFIVKSTDKDPMPKAVREFVEFTNQLRAERYRSAERYLLQDQYDSPLGDWFVGRLKDGPYFNPMLDVLADSYFLSSDEQAAKLAKKAKELGNDSSAAWAVIRAFNEKNDDRRLALWREVRRLDPYHVQANLELARDLEKQGQTWKAMVYYNLAADGQNTQGLTGMPLQAAQARDRLEGPTPDVHAFSRVYTKPVQDIINIIQASGDESNPMAAALAAIGKRIALNGGNSKWVLIVHGIAYYQLGEYRKYIPLAEKLVKADPSGAGRYYTKQGDSYRLITDYPRAMASYSKALEHQYETLLIHYNKASIYVAWGDYDNALKSLNRALEMDPNHIWALIMRGNLYENILGQYEAALVDFEKVIALGRSQKSGRRYADIEARVSQLRSRIAQRSLQQLLN